MPGINFRVKGANEHYNVADPNRIDTSQLSSALFRLGEINRQKARDARTARDEQGYSSWLDSQYDRVVDDPVQQDAFRGMQNSRVKTFELERAQQQRKNERIGEDLRRDRSRLSQFGMRGQAALEELDAQQWDPADPTFDASSVAKSYRDAREKLESEMQVVTEALAFAEHQEQVLQAVGPSGGASASALLTLNEIRAEVEAYEADPMYPALNRSRLRSLQAQYHKDLMGQEIYDELVGQEFDQDLDDLRAALQSVPFRSAPQADAQPSPAPQPVEQQSFEPPSPEGGSAGELGPMVQSGGFWIDEGVQTSEDPEAQMRQTARGSNTQKEPKLDAIPVQERKRVIMDLVDSMPGDLPVEDEDAWILEQLTSAGYDVTPADLPKLKAMFGG